jgi:hypothetical protein
LNLHGKCRDMTKVTGMHYNFEHFEYPADAKEPAKRRPHPVTVKAKIVLKKLIDLMELPANPLDNLIHLCGGREVVAEMTGRKEMMEMQPDGSWLCVNRADGCAQQALNLNVCSLPIIMMVYSDSNVPDSTRSSTQNIYTQIFE